MAYGYVSLPMEFTTLLQNNMQTSGRGYSLLKRDYWPLPQFQSVVGRATADLGNTLSFEQTINTLGWLGLRDRLAAYFLNHQMLGHYPESTTLEVIEDILEFEERIKTLNLNGYSRAFLFGFYLKMGHIQEQRREGKPVTVRSELIQKDIFDILKMAKSRVAEIDWLCLSLHYLLKFKGKERVVKQIEAGGKFTALQSELTTQQNYAMMKAFLAYGASIYHQEAFFNPKV